MVFYVQHKGKYLSLVYLCKFIINFLNSKKTRLAISVNFDSRLMRIRHSFIPN